MHPPKNAEAFATLDPEVGLIVHSHLRWDFVWQRPQQLLSRIARTNPVLFVEEPVLLDDVDSPTLDLSMPDEGLYRAIPMLSRRGYEAYDDAVAAIRILVMEALGRAPLVGRYERIIQWFYTPMPVPEMLGAFGEEGVVYDCMDELSQFRFAPTDIGRRERLLLSRADVVFTGGYGLYESKRRYHDNVHFFGCGVDAEHFAAARSEGTTVPADAASLPRPVMGYFGVIDERLDYELLSSLADARPNWTLLMIGPVVKVDPRDLPRVQNIHWLGQRSYSELPAYVKSFDVCLMPFALNEATEFINPTKTLEYMAAGKPIVSTPVADVVRNFAPIVRVADTAQAFVMAVTEAAEQPDNALLHAGIERAAEASWESIVQRMRELIAMAVATRSQESAADGVLSEVLPPKTARSITTSRSTGKAPVFAPDRASDAA